MRPGNIIFGRNSGILRMVPIPGDPKRVTLPPAETTLHDMEKELESIARRIRSREHRDGGLNGELATKAHRG